MLPYTHKGYLKKQIHIAESKLIVWPGHSEESPGGWFLLEYIPNTLTLFKRP